MEEENPFELDSRLLGKQYCLPDWFGWVIAGVIVLGVVMLMWGLSR